MTQIKTEGKNYLCSGQSLCQGAIIRRKTVKMAAEPQKAAGNVV